VLTVILLAQSRYESSIYVGSVALVALIGWWRAGSVHLPVVALLAPLLLVPYALHNTYLAGTPILWELRDGYEVRFSFKYLVENLGFARVFFFNTEPRTANSLWLTFAGGAAALWALGRLWRKGRGGEAFAPTTLAVLCFGLGIVGNLALLMAYYWGDLSDPVASRLSLPFHVLLALALVAALARWPVATRELAARWAIALALVGYVAFGLPVNQRMNELNTMETAQRWEERVVAERGPGKRLVLTDKSPLTWFARGISSTTVARAVSRPEQMAFQLRHHSFDEILVTQILIPLNADGDYRVMNDLVMPERFVLEPVAEKRIGTRLQRISILREVRDVPEVENEENEVDAGVPASVASTRANAL
jgi:hypothetical protein